MEHLSNVIHSSANLCIAMKEVDYDLHLNSPRFFDWLGAELADWGTQYTTKIYTETEKSSCKFSLHTILALGVSSSKT